MHSEFTALDVLAVHSAQSDELPTTVIAEGFESPAFRSGVGCPAPLELRSEDWAFESLAPQASAPPQEHRSSRLAKKAESARYSRLRHKSHVTDLQATLRSLRWQIAELQSEQRDRETAALNQLTAEIAEALPPARREAFAAWFASAPARGGQARLKESAWEPELALCALSSSDDMKPVGASPQSVIDDVASTGLSPLIRGIGLASAVAPMPRRAAGAEEMECALGIIGLAERAAHARRQQTR